jgi:predicted permease
VLDVFLNVIMPVFIVTGLSAMLQRWRKLPVAPLSQTTLWLFSPAFIFNNLLSQDLAAGASLRMVGAASLGIFLMLAATYAVSKALRHSRDTESAFLLAGGFPNAGNMGIPVLVLAFGDAGLAPAIIVFVTHSVVGFTVAIWLAARSQLTGIAPFLQVLKLPTVYAVAAAFVVSGFGWDLPLVISEPIRLLSSAAVPVMLMVLGFQLGSGVEVQQARSMATAVFLRLIVSVPLAYLATLAFGLEGLAQGAVIIVGAMPTAIFTTILATEFKANPRFLTGVVVAGTAISVVTLTVVVTIVRNLVT